VRADEYRNWWVEQFPPKPIDWAATLRRVETVVDVMARIHRIFYGDREQTKTAPNTPSASAPDAELSAAAALVGVKIGASEKEIRAAARARMTELRIHPDHGGDEERAKRFNVARDLLLKHAKVAHEAR
jgi:hypothetical protein